LTDRFRCFCALLHLLQCNIQMSMNENCLCVLVMPKTAKVSVSVSGVGVGLGLDPAGFGLGLGLPGLDNISAIAYVSCKCSPKYYALMALFIRPQIPTFISSSHADMKSCTPTRPRHPPKTEILKNILFTNISRSLMHSGLMQNFSGSHNLPYIISQDRGRCRIWDQAGSG